MYRRRQFDCWSATVSYHAGKEGPHAEVCIRGSLTGPGIEKLKMAIKGAKKSPAKSIALDLTKVDRVCSNGVCEIIRQCFGVETAKGRQMTILFQRDSELHTLFSGLHVSYEVV